jgi:hypothetical protein
MIYNGYLNVSDKLEQLLEVGDTESSCRIPALGGVPEGSWNDTRLDRISFVTHNHIGCKKRILTPGRGASV